MMGNFMDQLQILNNKTYTTNGDLAVKSTFNANLDFFGFASSRCVVDSQFKHLLFKAWDENPALALANLLYLRDIKGGSGKRETFRNLLKELLEIYQEDLLPLLSLIPQIGRWDDTFVFFHGNEAVREAYAQFIKNQLQNDLMSDNPSLLAKWLPSKNNHRTGKNQYYTQMVKMLNLNPKEYRKMLTQLRTKLRIVEHHVSTNRLDKVDYAKIPGKALFKYHHTFKTKDKARFEAYLEKIAQGKVSAKTATLMPHEIVEKGTAHGVRVNEDADWDALETLWSSMELPETKTKAIVVRDGSGSMYGRPLAVASALALKMSAKLPEPFRNNFITFSSRPKVVPFGHLDRLKDQLELLSTYNEVSNTNIEATYDLIYQASLGLAKEDQLDKIIIISDMQFDMATARYNHQSTYDAIKKKFLSAGLKFPTIVFWNVNARNVSFPTNDLDCVHLISGYSQTVMKGILEDSNNLNAEQYMYQQIKKYLDYPQVQEILNKL